MPTRCELLDELPEQKIRPIFIIIYLFSFRLLNKINKMEENVKNQTCSVRAGKQGIALPNENFSLLARFCPVGDTLVMGKVGY